MHETTLAKAVELLACTDARVLNHMDRNERRRIRDRLREWAYAIDQSLNRDFVEARVSRVVGVLAALDRGERAP